MNSNWARDLEREIEAAIRDRIDQLAAEQLPVRPTGRTIHMMAKAALAVYEAVDGQLRQSREPRKDED